MQLRASFHHLSACMYNVYDVGVSNCIVPKGLTIKFYYELYSADPYEDIK